MRRVAALAIVLIAASCTSDGDGGPSPTPSAPVAGGFAWSDAPAMPTPRTEVSVAALDGDIYAAGGFLSSGDATDRVERFDGDAWGEVAALPEPVHHAGLVAAASRLYLVGGYDADGQPTADVWSYAEGDDGWRPEADLPTARGALAVAVVGDRIHAVGGATAFGGRATLSGAHEAYDPEARVWQALDDLPAPRDHLAAAGLDGVLYVAGGRELSLETNTARLDIYSDRAWRQGPDMPTARGGLAAAAADGRVLVFGGEEPQGTFAAAEAYDVADERWVRLPDLPSSRHGLGAATDPEDRVYVVGGGPQPGLTVSGTVEVVARSEG